LQLVEQQVAEPRNDAVHLPSIAAHELRIVPVHYPADLSGRANLTKQAAGPRSAAVILPHGYEQQSHTSRTPSADSR
jgi:hypothetical protein